MANEQRPTAVTTPDQTAWDFCGQAEAKAQTNRSNVQEDQLDVDILKLQPAGLKFWRDECRQSVELNLTGGL